MKTDTGHWKMTQNHFCLLTEENSDFFFYL